MTDALERERSDQPSDTQYPRRLARQEKPRLSLSSSITSLHKPEPKGNWKYNVHGHSGWTLSTKAPSPYPGHQPLTYLVHSNSLRLLATPWARRWTDSHC